MIDSVVDLVIEPFGYGFMTRALIVSVLVGIMCPIVGSYVVTRGLAFMGDALAHAVLPGTVIALVIGVSPFFAAVPMGIAVAVAIGYLSRHTGISEDTSIGIIFAGMFALGLALLTTTRDITVDVEGLLLGRVLGVTQTDVYFTAGLAALALLTVYLFHKELVFSSFDPIGASVIGLPTSGLDYLLMVLLALVIVISIQAAGIVLVMAMLVTPAATAYLLVRSFTSMIALAATLGAISAVVGLYLSFYMNLPSGPAMTLVATVMFLGVAAVRRRAV